MKSEESKVKILKNYFVAITGKTNIAFPIASVFGVYPMPNLASIPNAPEHVLGVTVIMQQVLPIVDIVKSATPKLILILENDHDRFGLGVEQVKGIFEIPAEAIKAVERNRLDIKPFADYALGVWENGGEPVWLINPKKMVWASLDNIKMTDINK